MPHIKSKFPLPPPIPDANAHHAMFGNPGEPLPVNFTVHIDMASSQRRSFHELRQRTLEGATALVAPTSAGGLGLNIDVGHMVGVYSHNCMVSDSPSWLLVLSTYSKLGLRSPSERASLCCCSFQPPLCACYGPRVDA